MFGSPIDNTYQLHSPAPYTTFVK